MNFVLTSHKWNPAISYQVALGLVAQHLHINQFCSDITQLEPCYFLSGGPWSCGTALAYQPAGVWLCWDKR
jgi:hypothetical protein